MRAAVLGLPSFFVKLAQTQQRKGREQAFLLLRYHLSVSQTLRFVFFAAGFVKRVFFQTQRRRGERMSSFFSTVIVAQATSGIVLGLRREVHSNPAKKGERICVDIFIEITA